MNNIHIIHPSGQLKSSCLNLFQTNLVNSNRKVTKRMPPASLAPKKTLGVPEFSSVANEPVLMRRPGAQG